MNSMRLAFLMLMSFTLIPFAVVSATEGEQVGMHHYAQSADDHQVNLEMLDGTMSDDMQKQHAADAEKAFFLKRHVDGYIVSFHVMKPTSAMQHGGDHNFMIKVEKDGVALSDLMVNSKVLHANDKSESKMMMKMGDWYMAGYDLDHGGKHQLMVLFKTADGAKHFGGVLFPQD